MSDRIDGLAGVLVWTTGERFEAMRGFYMETLGLTPRSDREHFVNFAWSAAGRDDLRLTISVHPEIDGPSREPLRIMINLAVDDIDEVAARLEARGVDFTRPPETEPWDGRIATFHDPDGNTLQLLQPAPPRSNG
jgi:predicted enzyme related to lactoylglutathione lyase